MQFSIDGEGNHRVEVKYVSGSYKVFSFNIEDLTLNPRLKNNIKTISIIQIRALNFMY